MFSSHAHVREAKGADLLVQCMAAVLMGEFKY